VRYRNHLRSLAAGTVALVAAIASYSHMKAVAIEHGQPELLAALMPLSVDGLLIVASIVMAEDRENGFRPRPSARGSFWGGVAASIAANVLAAPDDVISRLISGWPAIALFAVVEMLVRPPRKRAVHHPATTLPPAPATVTEPATDPGIELQRGLVPATRVAASAEPFPLVASLPSGDANLPPVWKTAGQSNAERVKLTAARLPDDATLAQIAAGAGVSESTVRRYLPDGHPLRSGKARKPAGADPAPVGVST
jgi:hypothetical protein